MLKKMMLLASALAAFAAFAIPAAASASVHWVHNQAGVPVTVTSGTESFTGFAEFDVKDLPGTAFGCQVHALVHITGTDTANVDFEITTAECEGTGLLKGCTLEGDNNSSPWTVDVNPSSFTITNVLINNEFDEGCLLGEAKLNFGAVTATPDNVGEISSLTLSGQGTDTASGLAILATGTLKAENPGTYGIEVLP